MLDKLHVIAAYEPRSANSRFLILIRDAIGQFDQQHGAIRLQQSAKDTK